MIKIIHTYQSKLLRVWLCHKRSHNQSYNANVLAFTDLRKWPRLPFIFLCKTFDHFPSWPIYRKLFIIHTNDLYYKWAIMGTNKKLKIFVQWWRLDSKFSVLILSSEKYLIMMNIANMPVYIKWKILRFFRIMPYVSDFPPWFF